MEVMLFLLHEGVDTIDIDEVNHWTLLHLAAFQNNLPMVSALLPFIDSFYLTARSTTGYTLEDVAENEDIKASIRKEVHKRNWCHWKFILFVCLFLVCVISGIDCIVNNYVRMVSKDERSDKAHVSRMN